MVGGVEQEFDAAKELLTCMGSNVIYCGEVGTGQVMLDEYLVCDQCALSLFVTILVFHFNPIPFSLP